MHAGIEDTSPLQAWLDRHDSIFVLTGAGISTNSGIPDYRGDDGQWKHRAPINYRSFLEDRFAHRRYWARSLIGWPVVARASPNRAHARLVDLNARGKLSQLVTQNVDGLHQKAGHPDVIDLHGRIDQVICLACQCRMPRADVQQLLIDANPQWVAARADIAPDGDADVDELECAQFRAPQCPHCAGMLKPDVVFFGENVPRDRVESATQVLRRSDAMLVVGSSLMVYSGFRFARMAREAGLPLAILNRGTTRADDIATLRLKVDCELALASISDGAVDPCHQS